MRARTIDGFRQESKDAFRGYSAAVAARYEAAIEWLGRKLHVEIEGIDRLPPGRALLVANHAFGWDIAFAAARIHALTGRRVWGLGEHAWWVVPVVRRLAAAVGLVDGTPRNADELLARDELVLVLPGGLREALKPRELRYRLLWGHRYGFIRAAIRNHAPIVPLASLGADDLFDLVGDAYARARRLGLPFPLPRPAHLYLPIARRSALRFVIGEPIPIDVPPSAATQAPVVRRLRREVEGALHEIFEERLARRAGFPIDNPAHDAR
jgi:1-acyl-sn-glycerol-3-phosphate acyltransferase